MPGFNHGDYWTADDVYGEIETILGKSTGRVEEERPSTHPVAVRCNPEERRVTERAAPQWHGRLAGWRAEADPDMGGA